MSTPMKKTESTEARPAGRAILSLVLGILSVVLAFLICGGMLGIVGLTLGWLYLSRPGGARNAARWGVALSVVGILLSAFVGHSAYRVYREVQQEVARREALRINWSDWYGVEMPDVQWMTLEGETVHLQALRGRKVILAFFDTWRPACMQAMADLVALGEDIPADELVVVGLSDEDRKRLRTYVEDEGISFAVSSAVYADWPAPYAHVVEQPTLFFIDRNGVLQVVKEGHTDLEKLRFLVMVPDREDPPRPAPVNTAHDNAQAASE